MIDTKFIDDLARQISGSIPSGLREMQQDVKKNVHTMLQSALSKLDLVTREEFDVQSRVLLRTREKLDKLEKIIATLEAEKSKQ
jgi:BMFP domain-containing protein YqiC